MNRITRRKFLAIGAIPVLAPRAAKGLDRLAGGPLGARVAMHLGRPTLFLHGEPALPAIYALGHCPGYRFAWEERAQYSVAEFARADVRLFQAEVWMEQLWTSEREFSIEPARKQIRGILDAYPEAAVMLRLQVNSPPWWDHAHPEECVQWANGPWEDPPRWGLPSMVPMEFDLRRVPRHSLASQRWLDETGAKTREFCRALAATPEGDALFCIQVAAGVYGEWHYYGFIENEPDTGPAMTHHFRDWLRAKYRADQELQAAWNDNRASLASATVPGTQERMRCDGYLRDPRHDRKVIDYLHCQHQAVTDAFIHFCRTVKESWPRPIVTGGFHGYWFTLFGRMGMGGHLEVRRALESPYVDVLCAPQSYHHLELGKPGMSRGVTDAGRLHGKLYLDEMDSAPETWDKRIPDQQARADSVAILRRNVLGPFSRGMGLWYYDLVCEREPQPSGGAAGWWDSPEMQAEIVKLGKVQAERNSPPFVSGADVLLVFDTESFYYTGHNGTLDPVSTEIVDNTTTDLYCSGAAFDMAYLFDLEKLDLRPYKAVIFAYTFCIDPSQRRLIQTKVAQDGRHLFWLCAPGIIDGTKLNPESISALVGIKVAAVKTSPALVIVQAADAPACKFGFEKTIEPLFAAEDADAKTLGKLQGSEHAGLVRKQLAGHTAWFSSVPLRDPNLLRYLLREAGAHIYDDQSDVLYAGSGMVIVHSASGGPRTILLHNGRRIEAQLPAACTWVFDSETGEKLM
ncbi:MAG: beta-galactosidase [Terriglobia bacterium]